MRAYLSVCLSTYASAHPCLRLFLFAHLCVCARASAGNSTTMDAFALTNLMAGVDKYYRYQGGLTTPTCNEVVTWTVFAETIKISASQVTL